MYHNVYVIKYSCHDLPIGSQGYKLPFVIVQYSFSDGISMPIEMAPHSNSSKNKQPLYCTKASTYESIKENISTTRRSWTQTYKKASEFFEVSSVEYAADLHCKSSKGTNCDKDDLLEQHYVSEKGFFHMESALQKISCL